MNMINPFKRTKKEAPKSKFTPQAVCKLRSHNFEFTWFKHLNPNASIHSPYFGLGYRMTTCTRYGHIEEAPHGLTKPLPHYIPGDTTNGNT
jgi:hypothetical protein